MKYQWGRKEPFTFATSSFHNGGNEYAYGKYPVKIYNDRSELIYQDDNGGSNSSRTPLGGIIHQTSSASSMMETIKKPNVLYGYNSAVISQIGQSKELWNYYWTSYSRGVDGRTNNHPDYEPSWHNTYLDGYIVLRPKSIYDPCPYGYRTPTNGTYNDFISNPGWTLWSYLGGVSWSMNTVSKSWFISGWRGYVLCNFVDTGRWGLYYAGVSVDMITGYTLTFNSMKTIQPNRTNLYCSSAFSVRCIEDATVKADHREASAKKRRCHTDIS